MPSHVIRWFTYDDERRELRVVFTSGKRYIYQDVPREIYDSMRAAFSKGEFFNEHIRDRFRFIRDSSSEG